MKLVFQYNAALVQTFNTAMTAPFLLNLFKWIICLASIYFHLSVHSNEKEYLKTIRQAEQLFFETLYSDALPLYRQSLHSLSNENLESILKMRLARCYLEEEQPDKALSLLLSLKPHLKGGECLYFLSRAHSQLREYPKALGLLLECSTQEKSINHLNLIHLEKGYQYTRLGDLLNAVNSFNQVKWQKNSPNAFYLAQLHLIRVDLMARRFDKALQGLENLSSLLPEKHPLNFVKIYLFGWLNLAKHKNSEAAKYFEQYQALISDSKSKISIEALTGLVMSYLRQALFIKSPSEELKTILSKAEVALEKLLNLEPSEKSYLILSDFYLIKAKKLGDPKSYLAAQELFEKNELFFSDLAKQQILLKKVEAACSYEERQQLYLELSSSDYPKTFQSKIFFFKGLNDFEEGLNSHNHIQKKDRMLEEAARSFQDSLNNENGIYSKQFALALKYLSLSYAYHSQLKKKQLAWETVSQLLENPRLLETFDYPQEIYCLAAWIALHLSDREILIKAREYLKQGQGLTVTFQEWKRYCLKLEGLLCLKLKEWQQGDSLFAQLIEDFPETLHSAEAWFWRAFGADQQNNFLLKKEFLEKVYSQTPHSPFAPMAFFYIYSYRDYMEGHRKAIKHLQSMPLFFSSHPLLITANYLLGMYHKKDLISETGKVVRRKDWTAAIAAFQSAEDAFDSLVKKKLIPDSELFYFTKVKYQAQLERAQANLAIARASMGGKRHIYLEYAEDVFKQILSEFSDLSSSAKMFLEKENSYPKIWAETEFNLAETYVEKKAWEAAENILNKSLDHFRDAQITQGYALMRIWIEKGKIAQCNDKEAIALKYYIEGETLNKEFIGLSMNEKLDLWIQESLCYKALHEFENAMRLLSKVINEEAVSPLRMKAMFLRAEVYELQGRPELALKQLKATAHQRGEWAKKAQEKMDELYAN